MSDFEEHRSFLVGLAYRMLGSVADAEDVVQDAFLRWGAVDQSAVEHPRAYLARVVSRLCLDRMKSATARREQYVGTWLPEPVVAPAEAAAPLAEDLSLALLLTLERLSPLERAAFLLHDVFDMDYADVAAALDRTEAACRQLAARARDHVRDSRPRFSADPDSQTKLGDAFHTALATGDLAALAQILADDAILYTDGGGKRVAALNPIYGKDKILRFIAGVSTKGPLPRPDQIERAPINGLPGVIVRTEQGVETMAIDTRDGKIAAIYIVRNPDKLRHLS
jgi:RNA polymerase sigma-70 factor, ECF subfamily